MKTSKHNVEKRLKQSSKDGPLLFNRLLQAQGLFNGIVFLSPKVRTLGFLTFSCYLRFFFYSMEKKGIWIGLTCVDRANIGWFKPLRVIEPLSGLVARSSCCLVGLIELICGSLNLLPGWLVFWLYLLVIPRKMPKLTHAIK